MVLGSLRGPESIAQICREIDISEMLLRTWRDHFVCVGSAGVAGKSERRELDELCGQVSKLEWALGR